MIRQLAFDLPAAESYSAADFYPSPANAAALLAIQSQPRLLLIGPPGSGKTHLTHIWAASHQARIVSLTALPDALPTLTPSAAIAIDAADLSPDEPALFHLFNLSHAPLLLTASTPPRDWSLLPDLQSRLQTLPTAQLFPPDDALLSAVLIKLFADRQISVPPNLIPYLTSRMTRSIAAARALVATLDATALAKSRPITRAFAAGVLDTQFQLPLD